MWQIVVVSLVWVAKSKQSPYLLACYIPGQGNIEKTISFKLVL